MSGEVVLVTGGTGFIATHCIVQLLHAGYRVRTTVRSLDRAGEVRDMVRRGEADPDRIEFVVAELGRAALGCRRDRVDRPSPAGASPASRSPSSR